MRTFVALGAVLMSVVAMGSAAGSAGAQGTFTPAKTTTVVKTDCSGGGRFVVKQTRLASGDTRVAVAGHGVPNGRWKGSFSPDFSSSGDETDLVAEAVGHEFKTSVVVENVTGDTNATMLRGSLRKTCAVGLTLTAKGISISSPTIALVARSPEPGTLTTVGLVVGCDRGTRWDYDVLADFGNTGLGFGAGGIPCRNDRVKISKSTVTYEPPVAGTPNALSLTAHSGGDVRKISFETSAAR